MSAMPPRTLGQSAGAQRPTIDTTATVTQLPARQVATAPAARNDSQPTPPQSARRRVSGRAGLDEGDPSVQVGEGGGGGFKRKRDDEWDPLSPTGGRKQNGEVGGGYYDFDLYVNKIIAWDSGGTTVGWRVNDWSQDAGRSGPHHGRPIPWDQQMSPKFMARRRADNPDPVDREKAERAYKYWRAELVGLYDGAGFPESSWPVDARDNPVPPWDEFFVYQCKDGVFIPVMFRATVVVEPARQNFPPKFVALARIDVNGSVVQAPMPYELPVGIAGSFRWNVTETRDLGGKAQVEVVDRDSVTLGHLNLPTYKDI